MLTTHLNSLPYTKFVLIEGSIKVKGGEVLDYIVKNHAKRPDYKTYYLKFHTSPQTNNNKHQNAHCQDFSKDILNWSKTRRDLNKFIADLSEACVLIIDSLAHVIFAYGLAESCRIFKEIKNKTNVHQVVTLLHTDLLEQEEKVVQYFRHLATLHMSLIEHRVYYTFKKGHRKIITQIEEYRFENERFITEPIKKRDEKIVDETITNVIPENMSTFKISLSEKDKESRSSLVLPYLPKTEEPSEPKIEYAFDAIDDWDEEDPDDDLDI